MSFDFACSCYWRDKFLPSRRATLDLSDCKVRVTCSRCRAEVIWDELEIRPTGPVVTGSVDGHKETVPVTLAISSSLIKRDPADFGFEENP